MGGKKKKKITIFSVSTNDHPSRRKIEDGTMTARNPGQVARWFPSGRKGWADLAIRHVSHRRTLLQGLHEVEWPRIAGASLSLYLSISLPLAQPCEMNIFRKQRPPAFFSPSMPGITMSPVLSFFPVSLFLLFFEKHIYNGRCATVFYFFYFFSPESQYNTGVISVKIFATIFTSFHPTDTVSRKDRWLCVYIYILLLYRNVINVIRRRRVEF